MTFGEGCHEMLAQGFKKTIGSKAALAQAQLDLDGTDNEFRLTSCVRLKASAEFLEYERTKRRCSKPW